MRVVSPDPDAMAAVRRLGRPALAWEVLRRDRDYQAAVRVAGRATEGRAVDPTFAARWGLHFR